MSPRTLDLQDKFKLDVKVHVERLANLKDYATVYRIPPSSNKVVPRNRSKVQHVRFMDNNQSVNFKKDLRKRKIKNYIELLCSCSPNEKSLKNKCEEHLPIYLKRDAISKSNKRPKDPFEFVPETPRAYKKRLHQEYSQFKVIKGNYGKLKNVLTESDRNSILYDKDTHDILKRLEAREEAQLRAKQKQGKNKLTRNNKCQVVSSVNNKIKVKAKTITTDQRTKSISSRKQVKNMDVLNTSSDDIGGCFGFVSDSEEDDAPVLPASIIASQATEKTLAHKMKVNSRKANKMFGILTSTPVIQSRQSSRSISSGNSNKLHIISNIVIPSKLPALQNKNLQSRTKALTQHDNSIIRQSRSLEKQATFPAASTPQNRNMQKGVNKHNSIIRKSHMFFPAVGDVSAIAATSPQNRNQRDSRECNSPWRSDSENVSRHPYFLTVKNTSLPSYNQEMILESKAIEAAVSHKKKSIQTSMLDFIEGSFPTDTPSKAIIERSLFDDSEFSPIKTSRKARTPSKSPAAKRNVFRILTPSNKQNVQSSEQMFDVDNYFGFDSICDDGGQENKENRIKTHRTRIKTRLEAQPHPTRILFKEARNLQQNIATNIVENVEPEDTRQQEFPEEQKDDAPPVALFEDLEVLKPPRRSYERKRARRVRIRSVDSDESEESIKPKTKRKDIRTPQEEEAFRKWVAQFNAMCDEVENHTLEIDSF